MKFYERKEIKDILAYLKLIAQPLGRSQSEEDHQCPFERNRGEDDREDRDLLQRERASPL